MVRALACEGFARKSPNDDIAKSMVRNTAAILRVSLILFASFARCETGLNCTPKFFHRWSCLVMLAKCYQRLIDLYSNLAVKPPLYVQMA